MKTYDVTLPAILKWLRANLLVMIFAGMLLLQFLTWREVAELRDKYRPPTCGYAYPCTVELSHTVAVQLSNEDRLYLSDIRAAVNNKGIR